MNILYSFPKIGFDTAEDEPAEVRCIFPHFDFVSIPFLEQPSFELRFAALHFHSQQVEMHVHSDRNWWTESGDEV